MAVFVAALAFALTPALAATGAQCKASQDSAVVQLILRSKLPGCVALARSSEAPSQAQQCACYGSLPASAFPDCLSGAKTWAATYAACQSAGTGGSGSGGSGSGAGACGDNYSAERHAWVHTYSASGAAPCSECTACEAGDVTVTPCTATADSTCRKPAEACTAWQVRADPDGEGGGACVAKPAPRTCGGGCACGSMGGSQPYCTKAQCAKRSTKSTLQRADVPGRTPPISALAAYEKTQCLDGSQAYYYFKLAPKGSAHSNVWLIHLQGGGWCTSHAQCKARTRSLLLQFTHFLK